MSPGSLRHPTGVEDLDQPLEATQILEMIDAKEPSIHGAKMALDAAKVLPPRGVLWQRNFIRECVFDVYKPYTYEEIAALVSS